MESSSGDERRHRHSHRRRKKRGDSDSEGGLERKSRSKRSAICSAMLFDQGGAGICQRREMPRLKDCIRSTGRTRRNENVNVTMTKTNPKANTKATGKSTKMPHSQRNRIFAGHAKTHLVPEHPRCLAASPRKKNLSHRPVEKHVKMLHHTRAPLSTNKALKFPILILNQHIFCRVGDCVVGRR